MATLLDEEKKKQQAEVTAPTMPVTPAPAGQIQQDINNSKPVVNTGAIAPAKPIGDPSGLSNEQRYTNLGNQYADAIQASYNDSARIANESADTMEKLSQERQRTFAEQMIQERADYDAMQKELDADVDNSLKSARWTGATELATALINLAGVGSLGSSHQKCM